MRHLIMLSFLFSVSFTQTPIFAAQEFTRKETLSLSDAIAEALKSNPEVQVAKSKVEVARARASQSAYLEDPEVNLEAWGVPLSHPVKYRSANPLIVGVRQKLPFFGKLQLKHQMAGQEVKIAEQELRAKEQDIVAKVKSAYADYFMNAKNVEILNELLELVRHSGTVAAGLYQVGKVPQQDVIRSLLERTELLNKLTGTEKDLLVSRAKLNTLLSRRPEAALGRPSEPELRNVSSPFEQLEMRAFEQRPEVKAVESSLGRAESAVQLAERNRKYPDFMVGLQYWVAPDQRPRHMYAPMLTLTIPFSPWTRGRHDYEVQEALAERQAAKAHLAAIKNLALLEVREASARLEAAMKSISIYRDGLLPQVDQSFQAAIAAYQTGKLNFPVLLEAQRMIGEVHMGYYKALVDYEQGLADLERAVGSELR